MKILLRLGRKLNHGYSSSFNLDKSEARPKVTKNLNTRLKKFPKKIQKTFSKSLPAISKMG